MTKAIDMLIEVVVFKTCYSVVLDSSALKKTLAENKHLSMEQRNRVKLYFVYFRFPLLKTG